MNIFILSALAVLTYINYKSRRDIWFPAFIASALWLAVWTVYCLSPIPVDPVGVLTSLIFVLTVLSFMAGARLTLVLNPPKARRVSRPPVPSPRHPRIKVVLLLASIILLPLLFSRANELASQALNPSWFIGLRDELLATDTASYGLLGGAYSLSLFTTLIYAIELGDDRRERLQYYTSILVSFFYAILCTGRTGFLQIVIPLIAIATMQKRLRFRTVVAGALFIVVVFGIFVVVLAKAGDPNAGLSENLPFVEASFTEYTVGSLPAFDQIVRTDPPLEFGKNTFRAPVNVFRAITGGQSDKPDNWTSVPFPTNVYTGLQPLYRDFGILGVVFAFSMIGAVSTYCYLRAVRGERLYILYYSLSLYPLLMMTFDDQYFSPMLYWLKYLVAGYWYFRVRHKSETKAASLVGLRRQPDYQH